MSLVTLYRVPPNDHGCSGEKVVIRVTSSREGIIESVVQCNCCERDFFRSIMLTGIHDRVGAKVQLPTWFRGSWQDAAKINDLHMHSDVSFAESTTLKPQDLLITL